MEGEMQSPGTVWHCWMLCLPSVLFRAVTAVWLFSPDPTVIYYPTVKIDLITVRKKWALWFGNEILPYYCWTSSSKKKWKILSGDPVSLTLKAKPQQSCLRCRFTCEWHVLVSASRTALLQAQLSNRWIIGLTNRRSTAMTFGFVSKYTFNSNWLCFWDFTEEENEWSGDKEWATFVY